MLSSLSKVTKFAKASGGAGIQTQVCLSLELMLLVTVLYYLLIAKILSYQFIKSLVKKLSSVGHSANILGHRSELCGLVSF